MFRQPGLLDEEFYDSEELFFDEVEGFSLSITIDKAIENYDLQAFNECKKSPLFSNLDHKERLIYALEQFYLLKNEYLNPNLKAIITIIKFLISEQAKSLLGLAGIVQMEEDENIPLTFLLERIFDGGPTYYQYSLHLLDFFLAKGFDIDLLGVEGCSPVHAMLANHAQLDFLENDANFPYPDFYKKLIELLLKHKKDLDVSNEMGENYLHIAIKHKRLKFIDVLFSLLTKNQLDRLINSETIKLDAPLFYAAQFALLDVMKKLINNEAKVHIVNAKGIMPLELLIANEENVKDKLYEELKQKMRWGDSKFISNSSVKFSKESAPKINYFYIPYSSKEVSKEFLELVKSNCKKEDKILFYGKAELNKLPEYAKLYIVSHGSQIGKFQYASPFLCSDGENTISLEMLAKRLKKDGIEGASNLRVKLLFCDSAKYAAALARRFLTYFDADKAAQMVYRLDYYPGHNVTLYRLFRGETHKYATRKDENGQSIFGGRASEIKQSLFFPSCLEPNVKLIESLKNNLGN